MGNGSSPNKKRLVDVVRTRDWKRLEEGHRSGWWKDHEPTPLRTVLWEVCFGKGATSSDKRMYDWLFERGYRDKEMGIVLFLLSHLDVHIMDIQPFLDEYGREQVQTWNQQYPILEMNVYGFANLGVVRWWVEEVGLPVDADVFDMVQLTCVNDAVVQFIHSQYAKKR